VNNGKIMIYGCGGCGIELAKTFHSTQRQEGLADIGTAYVDTSVSNIGNLVNDDSFMLVDADIDGNAKVRKSNTDVIKAAAKLVPKRFTPGDLNVVVFSAAGGSGSVLGPLVASELQKQQDAPVICVVVGSSESYIEISNTIDTVRTLDGLARKSSKKPMLMHLSNNYDGAATSQVDMNVRILISQLAVLANGTHRGLDSADLSVWADYCRAPTCNMEPQLTEIKIVDSVDELKMVKHPISLVSVSVEKTAAGAVGANYSCYGLFTTTIPGGVSELHFVTYTTGLEDLMGELENLRSDIEDRERLRPHTKAISAGVESDDDGMVL
jgi:hypothetical protein